MTELWMVTLNGVPVRKNMLRREAEDMAARWQGSHCDYRGGSGLLKIKDRGDWVEVKRDTASEKERDERLKVAKVGDRQRLIFEQRID